MTRQFAKLPVGEGVVINCINVRSLTLIEVCLPNFILTTLSLPAWTLQIRAPPRLPRGDGARLSPPLRMLHHSRLHFPTVRIFTVSPFLPGTER